MLEALLLGELLRDGGRLGDRLRRRLARRLVPPLRAADGRGGGGGGGGRPSRRGQLHGARLGGRARRQWDRRPRLGKILTVSA